VSAENPVAGPLPAWDRLLMVAEITTVGLPFCVFKVVAGLHLAATVHPTGWALVGLGAVDLALNLVNAIAVSAIGRTPVPICVLHGLSTAGQSGSRRGELGLALDMMLSFILVAGMLALGRLSMLPSPQGSLWSASVVLNVLGAGSLRLAKAVETSR
jgi:hypothetical protein